MQRFRHWTDLPANAKGASVTIGNFDGVHRGHAALIAAARKAGGQAPLGIVTFEPHPREFFAPNAPGFRLMDPDSRARRFEALGADFLYELPFDQRLTAMSPETYVREVLVNGLGVSHVTIGEDFQFGHDRAGNAQILADLGREYGFGVTALALIKDTEGRFSSSSARHALLEGRPDEAARILGHAHRIEGPVLHGEKRGKGFGFPTANMALDGLLVPKAGVYAVRVRILSGPRMGEEHDGAASIGVRPTFGDNAPNIETYLIDFDDDLYDQTLSVALIAFIRPELKFDSVDDLIRRMEQDVDEVRAALARHEALSHA